MSVNSIPKVRQWRSQVLKARVDARMSAVIHKTLELSDAHLTIEDQMLLVHFAAVHDRSFDVRLDGKVVTMLAPPWEVSLELYRNCTAYDNLSLNFWKILRLADMNGCTQLRIGPSLPVRSELRIMPR